MIASMSTISTEYVHIPIEATVGGVVVNPTGDTVVMAFAVDGATPGGGDWKAASWVTTPAGLYEARCLVGPAGVVQLAAGTWVVWGKVTDSPEVPARPCGLLRIF